MRTNCLYTNVCGHINYTALDNSYRSGQEDTTGTMLCSLVALEDGNAHKCNGNNNKLQIIFPHLLVAKSLV